jgi:hypothetical protein
MEFLMATVTKALVKKVSLNLMRALIITRELLLFGKGSRRPASAAGIRSWLRRRQQHAAAACRSSQAAGGCWLLHGAWRLPAGAAILVPGPSTNTQGN